MVENITNNVVILSNVQRSVHLFDTALPLSNVLSSATTGNHTGPDEHRLILDESTCHMNNQKMCIHSFPNPGFRGVMAALALSVHALLNGAIDFVNEKCNRWWL